ncbi:hypothetical protein Ddye_032050 [Dipteronia dyeriana]|uniref:Uncharacterized protein n=1 Tax=Dipteronia dyeriana TaxID=168575 RepID=A0AAD9TK19_9ROSI|nr:hypothetical protein Ddye_032050 [Dipteronia dyeriana]
MLLATSVSVRSSPTVAQFDDHFFSDETSYRFPPDQFQLRSSPTVALFDDHFFSDDTNCYFSPISTSCLKANKNKNKLEVNSNNVDNVVNFEESNSQIRSADQNQSLLSGKRAIGNDGISCLTLAAQHFDYEVSRIELSRMILMHDYPLKMVEHEGFRDYTRSLQPLFKPISRTTARRDIMSMYEIERASFLTMLGKIPGRIAITSDMWTASNQKRGYMTVTSHFIDSSCQLQSRLLRQLSPSSLIMNGRLFHMQCAAHILNLIVKCGLDVIEFGIERIRDSVAFWTATPKRLDKFEEAANMVEKFDRYWNDVMGC